MTRVRRAGSSDPAPPALVALAVDVVVLTIRDRELRVLLVERGEDPSAGAWALPGGFVRSDEDLAAAAARELHDVTGIEAAHLEQFGTYDSPGRDPRTRVVTIAFLAIVRRLDDSLPDADASPAELVAVSEVLGDGRERRRLVLDHERILADGVDAAARMLETTSLATAFVGPSFTLSELREVYEATWGTTLDPGNFRRKVLSMEGFVSPTDEVARSGSEGGKPAQLYEAGHHDALSAPIQQPRRRGRQRG